MAIELTTDQRLHFLIIMVGGANKLLARIYSEADSDGKKKVLAALGEYNSQIEPVMDAYGLARTPEGIARAMMLTEDLIGCQPKGELMSVSDTEAVRKVTFCPWSDTFDGSTCRLLMAAMEEGVGRKYGLAITCDQTMAEGAEYCLWRVMRVERP